jgi:hypothetical protein
MCAASIFMEVQDCSVAHHLLLMMLLLLCYALGLQIRAI